MCASVRLVEARVVVGRNVQEIRRGLGLTQEDLAAASGLHPVEVSRAERGVRDLRVSTVVKLANGLKVPAGDLLRGL
jgi:transcriptional regulator with XRE-family HTH domain